MNDAPAADFTLRFARRVSAIRVGLRGSEDKSCQQHGRHNEHQQRDAPRHAGTCQGRKCSGEQQLASVARGVVGAQCTASIAALKVPYQQRRRQRMLKSRTRSGHGKTCSNPPKLLRQRYPDISCSRTREPDKQQPALTNSLGQHPRRHLQHRHRKGIDRTQNANLGVVQPEGLGQHRQQHILKRAQSVLHHVGATAGQQRIALLVD